jgi:hypothetical protein
VHGVPCAPQLVREGVEARGLTLSVVEEKYFGHVASFVSRSMASAERSKLFDREY